MRMSAKVKLSSALPGDEVINGLDGMVKQLLETPERVFVSLVWHDVVDVNHKVATGEDVPKVEVRKWIPVGPADEIPQELVEFALRKDEERLGRAPLPFDDVDPANAGSGALD
jgi:hypothetical protein